MYATRTQKKHGYPLAAYEGKLIYRKKRNTQPNNQERRSIAHLSELRDNP